MNRIATVVLVVVMSLFVLAPVASAHNEGHMHLPNGTCVDVGGGNSVPAGGPNAEANAGGIHNAVSQGVTPIQGGECSDHDD